jgi:hypothetical protein
VKALLDGAKNLKATILGGALPANAQYRNLFIIAGAALAICVLAGIGIVKWTAKNTPPGKPPRISETVTPIPDLYVD